jgi:4-alpha-glucanotransferase
MIRGVWSSVACFALAPLQDFLELGTVARMNFPGKPAGNWTWRLPKDALKPALQVYIRELNEVYGRMAE